MVSKGKKLMDSCIAIPMCDWVLPDKGLDSSSSNLLNPIVFSGRHNSKLLGFVTSQKLTFKKTDRDIHDA